MTGNSFEECLDAFVEAIQQVLAVDRLSIFVREDPTCEEFALASALGIPRRILPEIHVQLGKGVAGRVAESGVAVCVNDCPVSGDRYKSGAYLVAPVFYDGRVYGIICATDRTAGGIFREDDSAALGHLASVLGSMLSRFDGEHKLAEAMERMRRILASLPIGMLCLNEEGEIEESNMGLERLLHLDAAPRGMLTDALPIEDSSAILGLLLRLEEGDDEPEAEWSRFVDGSKLDLRASAHAACNMGGALVVIEDVTLGRTVRELSHLDDLKRDFISMVSHELRTPLTSLRGAASLLASMASEGLAESQLNMVKIIDRNAERLSLIVNKIVDVSLLDQQGLELVAGIGDIERLLEDIVSRRQAEAEQNHVAIVRNYEQNARFFEFDSERLYQAIDAVLHNAIKFSRADTSVTIDLWRDEELVHLRICDEGDGIPLEYRHQVFQKFFQIEEALTRKRDGAGLGLFFARKIAQLHGGDLVVHDSPRGASLEFTFGVMRGE